MKIYKIPASIKMAQAILESGWGNSDLAMQANNHFGIKCHNDWKGETYHKDDDAKDECFRKYKTPEESFVDHSLFLTTRSRYAALFALEISDYKAWAKGLKDAGYATNPKYPQLLTDLIEKYSLYRLDTVKTFVAGTHKRPDEHPAVKPEPGTTTSSKREIKLNNRVKYIVARSGDTFEVLAKELKMGLWQFYRYNELPKDAMPKEGQIIYLQPKRRRSHDYEKHTVKEGETLYSISQKYAVKTRHIHRLNPELHPDGDLNSGQVLRLK